MYNQSNQQNANRRTQQTLPSAPGLQAAHNRNAQMFIYGHASCEAVVRRCFNQLLSHPPSDAQSKENFALNDYMIPHIVSEVLSELVRHRQAAVSHIFSPRCTMQKDSVHGVSTSTGSPGRSQSSLSMSDDTFPERNYLAPLFRYSATESMEAASLTERTALQRIYSGTSIQTDSNVVWRPWR